MSTAKTHAEQPEVVILCGGRGMRLNERTESIPKPMVEVGGMPILWHLMKMYAAHGFNNFVLCLGYKGEKIREFFMELNEWRNRDFTLSMRDGQRKLHYHNKDIENWTITFADTGAESETGERIRRIEPYIKSPHFFCTYADGLASIDLKHLLSTHIKTGKHATVTCVQPRSQYGLVEVEPSGLVSKLAEKPQLTTRVNGGFFVFNREVFTYLRPGEVLERGPLERLVADKQLSAYLFDRFWMCMDTYKDHQELNRMWQVGETPWKTW